MTTHGLHPDPPKDSAELFDVEVSTYANASPETVFETLSDPEGLAVLMGCKIEGGLEVGAPIRFVWDPADLDPDDECCNVCGGEVTAIEPPRRFAFTWGHEAEGHVPWGSSQVEFLVEVEGQGSRITIRHRNLPDPEQAENHRGGWAEYAEIIAAHWS